MLSLFFSLGGLVSMVSKTTVDAYSQLGALLFGIPLVAVQLVLGVLIPILLFRKYRHQDVSSWLLTLLILGIGASLSAVVSIIVCLKLPATPGSGC